MLEITDKQKNAWTLACLAAPVLHTASCLYWVDILWVSLLCTGVRAWIAEKKVQARIPWLLSFIAVAAAAQALHTIKDSWPTQRDMEWIMMILLILAVLQAGKGEKASICGGILLWWLTAFLLGSVLVSGVTKVKISQWYRKSMERDWKAIFRLMTLLLIPCLLEKEKKRAELELFLLPVLCALIIQGILPMAIWTGSKAPFYEISRSIRLYGMLERMEAMAWLGLMLGTYLYFSFLMMIAGGKEEKKDRRIFMLLISAAAAICAARFLHEEILLAANLFGFIILVVLSVCIKWAVKRKERKM